MEILIGIAICIFAFVIYKVVSRKKSKVNNETGHGGGYPTGNPKDHEIR